ncbi:unnamed protein product [Allacma fusca]|uniref:Transmembrane protein 132E n=1 Tax=Allacma fusca TaxID=39272 RepID=A0A8J2LLD0_9HEXA|nr:unnamed protein product [Allacma fusca]
MWNITTDFNPRRTHATITAVRKFDPRFQERKGDGEEVFNWILEAAEEAGDDWDGGRVVWILRYVIQPSADTSWLKADPFAKFSDERHKLTTRLEVQKDDIQAVLPIAKSWEVVNSAVLNGKQVSRPMKIFIVSRAGQVADVTLQASCKSLDESVLKVSSSCTSVYVDGSEIRGSTNATIGIKYGTYEGTAQFIVWMPEFPLDIQLSDSKLSQIKGWRVPNGLRDSSGKRDAALFGKGLPMQDDTFDNSINDPSHNLGPTSGDSDAEVHQTWDEPEHEQVEDVDTDELDLEDKFHCRPRYQHSRIDVYGRFLAQDHDSGRTSYFISRKSYLKVTDLVTDYLRVSDTQIATIKGPTYTIQGVGPGRTEVQVVSPVTGRVLGAKEVRVVNDRVFIASMKVQVSSGVQLSLFPDTDSENEFVAETAITSKLSAKYQEALLDIKLRFSDNSWIRLDEIDREQYVLAVDSLDPTVVELPQIQNSKYPRILAVSEGGGPIMRVSLELSDQCHRQNSPPLAISVAQVEVNFTTSTSRSEFTQNDSNLGLGSSKHSFRKPSRGSKDRLFNGMTNGGSVKKDGLKGGSSGGGANQNDITGMPLRDDSSKASMPTHNYGLNLNVGFGPDKGWTMAAQNTPLQIAIYVLLGVFSVAILVFVASCVVYASRVKKREFSPVDAIGMGMKMEHGGRSGATTNAHDWVWLGRASLALHPSLDSSKNTNKSVSFESSGSHINPIRIITNPNFDGQPTNGSVSGGSAVMGSGIAATSQQSLNSNSANVQMSGANSSSSVVLPNNVRPFAWVEAPRLAPPPPRPPKPTSTTPIDSSTFSVKTPTNVPQTPTMQPSKTGCTNSPVGSIVNGTVLDCPDYRPPVPPHRNLPSPSPTQTPPRISTKHGGSGGSINGSHHSSSNPSKSKNTKDPDDLPNPSYVDFEPQQPPTRRGDDSKRTNIVGNPMCYIDEEDENDDDLQEPLTVAAAAAAAARNKNHGHNQKAKIPTIGNNVKLDMDYDQLMEYFDSLKETEA